MPALHGSGLRGFTTRVAIVGLAFALAWFFYLTAQLWLVFFGSILGALFLSTFAGWLGQAMHLPRLVALLLIFGVLLTGLAATVWVGFPFVSREVSALIEDWPGMLERFRHTWLGQRLLNGEDTTLMSAIESIGTPFAVTAMTAGRFLTHLAVGVFLTFFIVISPPAYLERMRRFFPPKLRPEVKSYLEVVGRALQRWIVGQLAAMLVIAVLMVIALNLLGVAYPYTLGILAGLCQFVPYLGPILWVVPATLIAGSAHWSDALIVVALYSVVQAFEGNILTPLIQRQAVQLPPVLTLLGTVMFGVTFGPLGVVLSTPFLVVFLVTYDRYWLSRIEERPPEFE